MNEMTNAKIKSLYLDKEFDVLAYPAVEDPNLTIISHLSLKNILNNSLFTEFPQLAVKHEEVLLVAKENGPVPGTGHYVYSCKIWDISGRCVMELGEVLPETLETEIAKKYPVTMAMQRAVDRAVISYLQLPGKAYSTEEGIPYDRNGVANMNNVLNANGNSKSIPATISKGSNQNGGNPKQKFTTDASVATSSGTKATAPVANATSSGANNRNEKSPSTTPPSPKKSAVPQPQGKKFVKYPGENAVLNLNKYKTANKTVEQVWETDPSYVEWVANSFDATTKEAQALVNACKNCLTYHKGGK